MLVFPGLDVHVHDGDAADPAGGDADIGVGRLRPPTADLVEVGCCGLEAAASGYEWFLCKRRQREDGPTERGVGEGRLEHGAHDRTSEVSSTSWSMRSLARMNSSSVSSASGPKQIVALP